VYYFEGNQVSVGTFSAKADAWAALALVEADFRRGILGDPRAGRMSVGEYSEKWLRQRANLSARTRELYAHVIEKHINRELGHISITALSSSRVRSWNARLAGEHQATSAKAYRLLSAIMKTAVLDGIIASTPCTIRGAGVERSAERPVATPTDIRRLEEEMPDRLRLAVTLAAWCQLRRGEILGLRRGDVDLDGRVIHIRHNRTFSMRGEAIEKEPKSRAGSRVLAVPEKVLRRLTSHIDRYVRDEVDAYVICDANGQPISPNSLHGQWRRARERAGMTEVRFHDLRHAGLTYAAFAGATTAELMHRAGHASSIAAMRYQHALRDRDRRLADYLDEIISPDSASSE
jgi:integrase